LKYKVTKIMNPVRQHPEGFGKRNKFLLILQQEYLQQQEGCSRIFSPFAAC